MGENDRKVLAQEGLDGVEERVPFHQGMVGRRGTQQGALHVGEPSESGQFLVKSGARFAGGLFAFEWRDSGHATWLVQLVLAKIPHGFTPAKRAAAGRTGVSVIGGSADCKSVPPLRVGYRQKGSTLLSAVISVL